MTWLPELGGRCKAPGRCVTATGAVSVQAKHAFLLARRIDGVMELIFVHGGPAAGKYTVGRILAERLGVPLFHNHLTVDLATTLFEFGSEPFVALRERIWLQAFELAAENGRSLVFTFQPESTVSPGFVTDVVDAVEERSGRVVFVELTCDESVLERRVASASRADFGKLTDPDFYRTLRDGGAFDFPPLPAPHATADTSSGTPEEAAESILAQLREVGVDLDRSEVSA